MVYSSLFSLALCLTHSRMTFSLRGMTGSYLPLSWGWRRWARWMKDSTPAWPSIPLSSRSAKVAPSPSLCCLVRRHLRSTLTSPVVLYTGQGDTDHFCFLFSGKLVWAFFVTAGEFSCQYTFSKNNVLFPVNKAQNGQERGRDYVMNLSSRSHLRLVKPLKNHISEEVVQCRGLNTEMRNT